MLNKSADESLFLFEERSQGISDPGDYKGWFFIAIGYLFIGILRKFFFVDFNFLVCGSELFFAKNILRLFFATPSAFIINFLYLFFFFLLNFLFEKLLFEL